MFKHFLASLLLLYSSISLTQKKFGLQNRLLNSFHGISSDHIKQTIEDKDGMIWFATTNGLDRYDGKNIVTYKTSDTDKNAIPHNVVRSLMLSKSGEIWIGTQKGLARKLNNNRFEQINNQTLGKEVFPSEKIIKIIETQDGNIWVATPGGLIVMTQDLNDYHTYRPSLAVDSGQLPMSDIADIFEDRFGNIWVSSWANGLTIIVADNTADIHSYKFLNYNSAKDFNLPKNITFQKIFQTDDDRIWLQESFGIFYRLDFKNGKPFNGSAKDEITLEKFNFQMFDHIGEHVYTSFYIRDIGLIVRSSVDSYIIPKQVMQNPNSQNSFKLIEKLNLGNSDIGDIFVDSRNIAWVASNKGVIMYFGLIQSLIDKLPTYSSPIQESNVTAIYNDYHGTWVATKKGLYIEQNNELKELKCQGKPISFVKSFEQCPDGSLWAGTIAGNLYQIKKTNQKFDIKRRDINGLKRYTSNNQIWDILCHRNGTMWIGTQAGVYRYDWNTHESYIFPFQIDDKVISDFNCFGIEIDNNDRIYISATGVGLIIGSEDSDSTDGYQFEIREEGTSKSELNSDLIFDIDIHKDKLWIAQYSGIEIYDITQDSFYRIPKLDESVNSQVYSVIASDDKVWATTPRGLTSYSTIDNTICNISVINGALENYSMLAHHKEKNGDILLGGSNGYHKLDHTVDYNLNESTYVILSSININNVPVVVGHDDKILKEPVLTRSLNNSSDITLSHAHHNVVINLSVPDFINPHQYKYSYILKGISDEWIELGQEQKIHFSGLPHQNFDLGIKAKDQFGRWTETKWLSVKILIPFWKKKSTYFCLALLILIGLFLLTKYREKRRQLKTEILENAVEQRTSELKEKNERLEEYIESNIKLENFAHAASHDIKAPLINIRSFVMLLKEELKNRISEEEYRLFNEIEKGTIRLNRLVDDILSYAKLKDNDINLSKIHISKVIDDVIRTLSSVTEQNNAMIHFDKGDGIHPMFLDVIKISRVIQNLLTNAIKFMPKGSSPIISITLEQGPAYNYVHITDNGIGIEEANLDDIFKVFKRINYKSSYDGTGFGLSISKKIMRLHGGDLLVKSEVGKGSTFSMMFPKSTRIHDKTKSLNISDPKTADLYNTASR